MLDLPKEPTELPVANHRQRAGRRTGEGREEIQLE